MLATRSELLEKIRLGEDSFLELKEVRIAGGRIRGPQQNDLADELAAFANSRGGVLLLGVEDRTREILGIPLDRLDDVETLVRQTCEDSIKPALVPFIERMTLPDSTAVERPILRIEVPRSLFVHKSPGGYFHRVGSSKREMAPDYLARLFQQRSQTRIIRFDEQTVSGTTVDDLDPGRWRRFITVLTQDEPEDFLQKLGMARADDDGVLRPTVAGILMGCQYHQRFLPNAFIQAVAYQGTEIAPATESAYQRDAQDIGGTLDEQIFGAYDFVRKNMRVMADKRVGRQDIPQFDLLAIFEAVANAVAHRDYSIHGSKIRLRLFEDRIELFSPGSIPNTMTVDSLPYRQCPRNETITTLLARCPIRDQDEVVRTHRRFIMDRRGEGVPIIFSHSLRLSGRQPIYRLINDSELILTIFSAMPP